MKRDECLKERVEYIKIWRKYRWWIARKVQSVEEDEDDFIELTTRWEFDWEDNIEILFVIKEWTSLVISYLETEASIMDTIT